MRLSKVRVTDHRPTGAGENLTIGGPPARPRAVASKTVPDYLTASQKREAEEHDRNIRDYTPAMVAAAWEDLRDRRAHNKKDPEQRWVMARLGAAMRKGGRA